MKRTAMLTVALMALVCMGALAADAYKPVTVSHRGANMIADENTLKAYKLAAYYGMDYFECDPRLTKDGVFVLMHDDNIKRTTGGEGSISGMTLAEVKALRTKNGEEVPTLAEALALAKKLNIKVYLDTKLHDKESLEKLAAAVKEAGMTDSVMMGLWTLEGQKYMQSKHPEISTSLTWPSPVPGASGMRKVGCEWAGTTAEMATAANIKKIGDAGLKMITLELNDAAQIREKMDAGLQVLQTDDPVMLSTVIGMAGAPVESLPLTIVNNPLTQPEMKEIARDLPEGYRLIPRLAYVTGYTPATNTPPGTDETSVPPGHARKDDGTYASPTTLAVNPDKGARRIPYGTMVYIPGVKWTKAEDLCGACTNESDLRYRVDLWLGPDAVAADEEKVTGWRWIYIAEKARL